MPVMKNPKYERVLINLVKGLNYGPAWTAAGFDATGNAAQVSCCRFMKRPDAKVRYAELMGQGAKKVADVQSAAREFTTEAIETLADVMNDAKAPPSARVAAANILLDRGHGKAVQHIEAEINLYDGLNLDEKRILLAALDALDGDEEGTEGGPTPTHH